MKIKYFGHAAFFINSGEYNILIDPFINGNSLCNVKVEDIPKIDYIFVTHGHGDHLGDTIEIAKRDNATVICNFEISLYLTERGVKCHGMHIGGGFDFPFGRAKMVIAIHGSSIEEDNNIIYAGNPCGFVIEIEGKKIYHAGDTALTMDMMLLKSERICLAMLPIGDNFTMGVKDANKAIEFIKPKLVIPMHYNTFDAIKADPKKVKNSFGKVVKLEANTSMFL